MRGAWRARVGLLAALAVGCGEGAPAEETEGGATLDDPRFAWCHKATRLPASAAPYCALLEEAPPEVCPGMREACAEGRFATVSGCGGGGAPGASARPADEPDPVDRSLGCDASPSGCTGLAGAVENLARWIVALLIALAAAVGLRLLLRRLQRRAASPAVPQGAAASWDEATDDPQVSIDPLAAAEAALARGDAPAAVDLARLAALGALLHRGWVRAIPGQTDRAVLRQLGRAHAAWAPWRTVTEAVEAARWAGRAPSMEVAASVVAAARRLLSLLLLAVVGFAPGAASATPRWAPDGDAALRALLEAHGAELVPAPAEVSAPGPDVALLVVAGALVDDAAALGEWVEAGGVAVVLGDRSPLTPLSGRPGRVATAAPSPRWPSDRPVPRWPLGPARAWCEAVPFAVEDESERGQAAVWLEVAPEEIAAGADEVTAPAADEAATVAQANGGEGTGAQDTDTGDTEDTDAAWDGVPRCDAFLLVAYPLGEGAVVALSDGRALHNAAMVAPENAALPAVLLDVAREAAVGSRWAEGDARTAVSVLASVPPAPLPQALLDTRLWPFVVHLLPWWALLVAAVGVRFLPAYEPREGQRRALVEHAVALGRHWSRVKADDAALRAVAARALRRFGADGLARAAARRGLDAAAAAAWARGVVAAAAGDMSETGNARAHIEEITSWTRRS